MFFVTLYTEECIKLVEKENNDALKKPFSSNRKTEKERRKERERRSNKMKSD